VVALERAEVLQVSRRLSGVTTPPQIAPTHGSCELAKPKSSLAGNGILPEGINFGLSEYSAHIFKLSP
jgi:hypothetical protein